MAVRGTMAALISRVRVLINDTGGSPVWSDQNLQDIMDEARQDLYNVPMTPEFTYSGSTVQYLDYMTTLGADRAQGGWEDDYVIKQFLVTVVTPSTAEPIAGHFHFATTTLPPLFITGKLFDVYRSAADILERWGAQWTLAYAFTSDGQSFQRQQALVSLLDLAHTYRLKQRAGVLTLKRSDIASGDRNVGNGLGPQNIDYYASGDGR